MNPVLSNLDILAWGTEELHKVIALLAEKSGIRSGLKEENSISPYKVDYQKESLDQWLKISASKMSIEIQPVNTTYSNLKKMLYNASPFLLQLEVEGRNYFIAILKRTGQKVLVLTPNESIKQIRIKDLQSAMMDPIEKEFTIELRSLFEKINLKEDRWENSHRFLLHEQLKNQIISGFWLFRMSPGARFLEQIKRSHIPKYLTGMITTVIIAQIILVLEWFIIGKGVLGSFSHIKLLTLALLLFTGVPFFLIGSWYQNLLSLDLGILFRQRLLFGILQLEPDETRHRGAGQYLGMVMESGNLMSLALGIGFTAILCIFELLTAYWILSISFRGWLTGSLLLFWIGLAFTICWYYFKHSRSWMAKYRAMINDLVERMIGQRTRLAQEDPKNWHVEEDKILENYFEHSSRLDKMGSAIYSVIVKGWLVVAFSCVASTFITSSKIDSSVIISLGGILLVSQALVRFSNISLKIIEILNSWDQIAPLFKAADRQRKKQNTASILPFELNRRAEQNGYPVLKAVNLKYSYHPKSPPVIKENSLEIQKGDKILLEGPSGGGKSTLAALLSGLREVSEGELYLWNVEFKKIGFDEWRSRIASAPQFHQNHVFTETLAFNLLMGRSWPPNNSDLEEAEIICRELGLGDLLDKMPAGIMQIVGEGGWQLSHGEKSRLYLARTLLQKSDLVILDESFGTLDPENLKLSLKCVLKRAETLLVIAHP